MKRREFLGGCAAFLAGSSVALASTIEPTLLDSNEKDVLNDTPFFRPLRLAHLTDLHCSRVESLSIIEDAIEAVVHAHPDIICITGDYIDIRLRQKEAYHKLLRRLSSCAPTYAIMGNHDGGKWLLESLQGYSNSELVRAFLETAGIRVLHNESVSIKHQDHTISLVGVGDIWAQECEAEKAFSTASTSSADRTILLSHNPDSKDDLFQYEWNLMLSGHTHGGQVIIPVLGIAPFAPVQDHLYVEGLKPWGERQIHVSRGLGSVMGIRFNCRPEVSILNIF